jgi:hypothetical protein
MYGRNLAGIGAIASPDVTVQPDEPQHTEPAWADNELKVLAEMDDFVGNGVFDPPNSRPTTYADAGVFGGRMGLPGYIEREKSFRLSEVLDATTGRPVVYVPGGAVSMDSAAQVAYLENGRYPAPRPVLDSQSGGLVPMEDTFNVMQNPEPIQSASGYGALPFGLSWNALAGIGAALGLAVGVGIALSSKKRKRSR